MTTEYPPSCQVLPGPRRTTGPGWYLVARNMRVEAGPFTSTEEADHYAQWMDENSMGVNPAPWRPRWSPTGLLIGTRVKPRERMPQGSLTG